MRTPSSRMACCEARGIEKGYVNTSHYLTSGDSALVIGAGPIGLAVLLCLHAFGAKTILISEIAAMRKAQAENFGADAILDPTRVDVVKKAQTCAMGMRSANQAYIELVHMLPLTALACKVLKLQQLKPFVPAELLLTLL